MKGAERSRPKARKGMRDAVLVAWRGPSPLDGSEIELVLSCLRVPSGNEKTGDMVQSYVLPVQTAPHDAIYTGANRGVCGDCPHRPLKAGTCYVTVDNRRTGITSVHRVARRLQPDVEGAVAALKAAGAPLRLGAWGDPAMVPFEVVQRLADAAPGHTGYTHQWRTCDPRFRAVLMASVDTLEEARQATAAGWRYFRVKAATEPDLPSEVHCPASTERGNRITCAKCRLCGGQAGRLIAKRPHVVIDVHGSHRKATRFARLHRLEGVRRPEVQLPLLQIAETRTKTST